MRCHAHAGRYCGSDVIVLRAYASSFFALRDHPSLYGALRCSALHFKDLRFNALRSSIIAVVSLLTSARLAPAQTPSNTGIGFVVAPAFQSWSFAKDVPLDSIRVSGASQVAVPFSVEIPLRMRWTVSITGAVSSSRLTAQDSARSITRSFSGLSDTRVRATGRLLTDALRLTVGLNLPTGAVNLSPEQNDVIRVTAAPALDARVPIAGTGLGGTLGLVYARTIGQWGWAFGAGVEQRGTYAPLEAQIAGVGSRTELDPGGALHVSAGADGLLGQNRLSLGVVADVYGKDQLHLTSGSRTPTTQQYQLGPTVSVAAALAVNNSRIRDLVLRINERYRSGFKNGNGDAVDGSSGNYLEFGASGLLGTPDRLSLLLGLSVRQHSGLPVDEGLIGAGLTAVGATVGVSIPRATIEWRPTLQVSIGSLKTERVTTGMTALAVGLSVARR